MGLLFQLNNFQKNFMRGKKKIYFASGHLCLIKIENQIAQKFVLFRLMGYVLLV